MRKSLLAGTIPVLFLALGAPQVHADLYAAWRADQANEPERAFELFREIAELGHPLAQKNVALSYVSGEGVKRDNVLGLAWARIAAENGVTDVQFIIDQLQPHVNAAAQARIEEVYAQFSPAALRARLLPIASQGRSIDGCKMVRPANPDDYYPEGGIRNGISGDVIIDFTVQPDGRPHTAYVVHASTPVLFDEAARAVAMHSAFRSLDERHPLPCDMRIKVKFTRRGERTDVPNDIEEKLPATRAKAEAGDPQAQLVYALVLLRHASLNSDREPVLPWALKAAQAGIPDAQYLVGTHTMYGMMVQKDLAKGEAWLRLAANSGHAAAQVSLARSILTSHADPDMADARRLLESAAATGDFRARYPLAALLATASDPALRDPKRALELIGDVMPLVNYDPVPHEIRAAAYAWLHEFSDAVRHQKVALARARTLGWDPAPLKARLELYENQKTWTGNLIAK